MPGYEYLLEALSLMLDHHWRERVWDNFTMVRLAKRKVQQLEAERSLTAVEFARGVSEVPKRARRYGEDVIAPTDEL